MWFWYKKDTKSNQNHPKIDFKSKSQITVKQVISNHLIDSDLFDSDFKPLCYIVTASANDVKETLTWLRQPMTGYHWLTQSREGLSHIIVWRRHLRVSLTSLADAVMWGSLTSLADAVTWGPLTHHWLTQSLEGLSCHWLTMSRDDLSHVIGWRSHVRIFLTPLADALTWPGTRANHRWCQQPASYSIDGVNDHVIQKEASFWQFSSVAFALLLLGYPLLNVSVNIWLFPENLKNLG